MTLQEIFDKVVTHLLKQNARAVDWDGSCQYRAPDGKMCAVGCLIEDSNYSSKLEGRVVGKIRDSIPNVLEGGDIGKKVELLKALQMIHDESLPTSWPTQLEALTKEGSRFYGSIQWSDKWSASTEQSSPNL